MLKQVIPFLRSCLFYAGYMIATLIISLLCIVVFWLLSVRNRFFLYSLWCQFVLFWLRVCCGIRYEIEGLDNIPDYPVVALSTHQSTWETIYLYYVLSPVCPILKKELLSIPFWGWALRLQRPIAIDRSKPREAGKSLLVQGKARLEEGLSVVIFPEGTRSKAGTVKNFSKGGAMLAVHANTPALPVIHNAGGCWPARKMVKMPGVIKVRVGEPIAVEGKTAAQVTAEYAQWAEANMDIIKN